LGTSQGKGKYLIQNHSLPQTYQHCKGHIGVLWDSYVGLWCVLSVNTTTPYHQPKNYMELDANQFGTCTWHGIYVGYHEPIFECSISNEKICLLYIP